jgi:adenylosuccinate synthase
MSTAIVILGSQYGDEAKGNLTDYLVNNSDNIKYVVRFNGGANAGHTIIHNNITYDTHLYPSGIINNNIINIIGNGVLMNITSFIWETLHLMEKGISFENINNNLIVSNNCHVTLLCQQYWDYSTNKIGTTNKGIGPTMACKGLRVAMRMEDFMNDNYINKIKKMYDFISNFIDFEPYELKLPKLNDELNTINNIKFNTYYEMMEFEINLITKYIDFIRNITKPVVSFINKIDSNDTILFEGANAFGLDTDFGTYPCVTSTSCITSACMSGSGISMKNLIKRNVKVIGVFKAYITRVGNGSLPTLDTKSWGMTVQELGYEYGVTTGRRRNCGHLDLVQLAYSTIINGYDELNITKLDVLTFAKEILVCIAYQNEEGELVEEFPSNDIELGKVYPVYKYLPGWNNITPDELKLIKNYTDLPNNIQSFIEYIENYLEKKVGYYVKIKYINTGFSRNDKIIRE